MEWEDKPEVEAIIKDLGEIGDVGARLIEATNGAENVSDFKHLLMRAISEEVMSLSTISGKAHHLKEW